MLNVADYYMREFPDEVDANYLRDYSRDEAQQYYADYLDYNLRHLYQAGLLTGMYIPLKSLSVRSHPMLRHWNFLETDPFLMETYRDKLELGRRVLRDGNLFHYLVDITSNSKLSVIAGNHRIASLKMLDALNEVPDDYKLFCTIRPCCYYSTTTATDTLQLQTPVRIRYPIEIMYHKELFELPNWRDIVYEDLKSRNFVLVREGVAEGLIYTWGDARRSHQFYEHFLRKLLHLHNISPNRAINDEEYFKQWLLNEEEDT